MNFNYDKWLAFRIKLTEVSFFILGLIVLWAWTPWWVALIGTAALIVVAKWWFSRGRYARR